MQGILVREEGQRHCRGRGSKNKVGKRRGRDGLGEAESRGQGLGGSTQRLDFIQSSSHVGRMGFDFWDSKLPSCQERGPRGHKTLLLRATGSGERLEWRRTGGSIRGAKKGD